MTSSQKFNSIVQSTPNKSGHLHLRHCHLFQESSDAPVSVQRSEVLGGSHLTNLPSPPIIFNRVSHNSPNHLSDIVDPVRSPSQVPDHAQLAPTLPTPAPSPPRHTSSHNDTTPVAQVEDLAPPNDVSALGPPSQGLPDTHTEFGTHSPQLQESLTEDKIGEERQDTTTGADNFGM